MLLTIPEVAAALRVSRRSVYRLFETGRLRPVHIGRRTLVAQRELDAFVASLSRW
jgi:excisionase family DNA binding protein